VSGHDQPTPDLRCVDLRELAPDVALGLLTGEERAAALAHLEGCEACRADVASLAVAADEVLLAAPEAAPPADFTARVLARLEGRATGDAWVGGPERPGARGLSHRQGPHPDRAVGAGGGGLPAVPPVPPAAAASGRPAAPARSARHRRLPLAALAAAAVVAVVAGILALVRGIGPEPVASEAADIRTGRGDVVGEATVEGEDVATVTVEVPDWGRLVDAWGADNPSGDYWLAIEQVDGTRTLRAVPTYLDGWTVEVDAPAADVVSVAMIDARGRTWCSATF
jgi:anti-sigma-K factor RskA